LEDLVGVVKEVFGDFIKVREDVYVLLGSPYVPMVCRLGGVVEE
jgi:hypothetical protein